MREDYTEGAWFIRTCVRLFVGFLLFGILCVLLVGCGSPRAGQTREDIAAKYGAPVEVISNKDGGTTCTYHERSFWNGYYLVDKLHVVTFDTAGRVVKGE